MIRNAQGAFGGITMETWRIPDAALAKGMLGTASPTRALAETFIRSEVPRLFGSHPIEVLDIGCGSGRMADLLAGGGLTGTYAGVDMHDKFEVGKWGNPAFTSRFLLTNAHDIEFDRKYDLVVSNSALEHIPDDARLIGKLNGVLSRDGVQVHLVPATWALFVYLWHGLRQYGSASLAARFGRSARVYRLGGSASLLLHLFFITVPEIFLRRSLRLRWPVFYEALLRSCLRIDRGFPLTPCFYAVVCRFREVRTLPNGKVSA